MIKQTAPEILDQLILEDNVKMLLPLSSEVKQHNGITYSMVRVDIAIAAMHQFAAQYPGWIKASERLPESDDECAVKLWFSPSKFVYDTAYYRGGVWYNCNTDNPIARDGLNPFKLEWLSESPAKPEGEDAFIDKHMKAIKGKLKHYKDAHELSGKLIDKHIKPLFNGLQKASVEYFLEKGTISGAFYEALTSMIFELFPDYGAAAHSQAVEEPVCTCKEFTKQRALCPVCDKEEYEKLQELIKNK